MNALLLRILILVVASLSPQVRKALEQLLIGLEEQAKRTDNPWDDILVEILKSILLNK